MRIGKEENFRYSILSHITEILILILELPHIEPIVVSIWCGNGKPTELNEFLDPFVEELIEILENRIHINNYKLTVCIRCFICDTPARAYIKGF